MQRRALPAIASPPLLDFNWSAILPLPSRDRCSSVAVLSFSNNATPGCTAQTWMPQLIPTLSPVHAPAAYGWMSRWRTSTEQLRKAEFGCGGLSRPCRSGCSRRMRATKYFAAGQLVPDSATSQSRPDRCPGAVQRGPAIAPQFCPGGAAAVVAGTVASATTPQLAIEAARRRITHYCWHLCLVLSSQRRPRQSPREAPRLRGRSLPRTPHSLCFTEDRGVSAAPSLTRARDELEHQPGSTPTRLHSAA